MKSSAVIYARVSSKEQEREGYSIEAQVEILRTYSIENNLRIVREFVDVETAKMIGRKAFNEMMDYLREHKDTRTVLVEKTDRLYRNFKDYVTLEEIDPIVHLVKEGEILSRESKSHTKFIHGIKVLMAKNYIDNLSEETRKGQTQKAKQGFYPSVAPLGYINAEREGKKVIVPDPERAQIIKLLYEKYASGRYSLKDVTEFAQREGLTYKRSVNKVHKSIIHKILTNPIYFGEFVWSGERYKGSHEPLVSRETWERCQSVLKEKGRRNSKQLHHSWAFQGILKCGHCGCAMTAEIKKGKYIYYHCTGHKGKCPEKYVREEIIAEEFGEALKQIRVDEDVLEWVIDSLKSSHADESKYHNEALVRLEKERKRLQGRLDAMYIDKLDENVSNAFYKEKSKEWRSRQEEISREIDRHRSANHSYLDDGIKILELSQRAVELYNAQEVSEKRRIVDLVFSNSTWSEGKLHPKFREPFDMLAVTNAAYRKKKATIPMESGLNEIWLLG